MNKVKFEVQVDGATYYCESFGSFCLTFDIYYEDHYDLVKIGKILGFFVDGKLHYKTATMDNNIGEEMSCPCAAFFKFVENFRKEKVNV